jgi:hypothetical protein
MDVTPLAAEVAIPSVVVCGTTSEELNVAPEISAVPFLVDGRSTAVFNAGIISQRRPAVPMTELQIFLAKKADKLLEQSRKYAEKKAIARSNRDPAKVLADTKRAKELRDAARKRLLSSIGVVGDITSEPLLVNKDESSIRGDEEIPHEDEIDTQVKKKRRKVSYLVVPEDDVFREEGMTPVENAAKVRREKNASYKAKSRAAAKSRVTPMVADTLSHVESIERGENYRAAKLLFLYLLYDKYLLTSFCYL